MTQGCVSDDEEQLSSLAEIELLPKYFPGLSGCRSIDEYHCMSRIEEGSYGIVYKAKEKRTDEIVAVKRLKLEREKEGFPITSLREINTLLKASPHENIVGEIVVGNDVDKFYIVMDYIEHDMRSLMENISARGKRFAIGEVKTLMKQLLLGVAHLHDNWILHRDLKSSNLLLSHRGILKIGDFGLAREYGSPLGSYTPIVVTLWYRAPELLLGSKKYSTPIDIWSVGALFAEFLHLKPLFPSRGETDMINKMLGTPNDEIWPGYSELPMVQKCGKSFELHPYNQLRRFFFSTLKESENGLELLNQLLTYDPKVRVSAHNALEHPWFEEIPRPVPPEMFLTWSAESESKSVTPEEKREKKVTLNECRQIADSCPLEIDHENNDLFEQFQVVPKSTATNSSFTLKFGLTRF